MRVAFFGTGYVGLVTGSCLAQTGNTVTCADIDQGKIDRLEAGECPIYEPGLPEMIEKNVKDGRLSFTTDLEKAVQDNYVLGIAVGTPSAATGEADLSAIWSVAKTIGEHINAPKIIVQKSTVLVGTGERIEKIINEELEKRGEKIHFAVVSNPEFLKEGSAVDDFMSPDRVVIGTEDKEARKALEELYSPLMRKGHRVIWMNRESAELTKYAANAMLATRISFINALARLAENVGADIEDMRQGIGSDSRIGKAFLYASSGFGGSCFPKDVRALVSTVRENELDDSLFRSVISVNESQRQWFTNKILKYYDGDVNGKTFAVWGLAFKAETDDVREAAALVILKRLIEKGAKIKAFDPEARETFKEAFGENEAITYVDNKYKALEEADGLIILTEWLQFRTPDFERIKETLSEPVIFDGRNLYDPKLLAKKGVKYLCVGRRQSAFTPAELRRDNESEEEKSVE